MKKTVKEYKGNFKNTKNDLENETKTKIDGVNKSIKNLVKDRQSKYKTILRTLKKQEKQIKKDQGKMNSLQKTKKKQESLTKTFKENNISSLVKKYDANLEKQLKAEESK